MKPANAAQSVTIPVPPETSTRIPAVVGRLRQLRPLPLRVSYGLRPPRPPSKPVAQPDFGLVPAGAVRTRVPRGPGRHGAVRLLDGHLGVLQRPRQACRARSGGGPDSGRGDGEPSSARAERRQYLGRDVHEPRHEPAGDAAQLRGQCQRTRDLHRRRRLEIRRIRALQLRRLQRLGHARLAGRGARAWPTRRARQLEE